MEIDTVGDKLTGAILCIIDVHQTLGSGFFENICRYALLPPSRG
jgi:hypothetical protein